MEEQGMIYRCPSCEAGMEYAINDQKLHCQYCGKSFSMDEWAKLWNEKNEKKLQEEKAKREREEAERIAAEQAEILAGEKEAESAPEWGTDTYFYDTHLDEVQIRNIRRRRATIKMQIVRCSACGAELATNEVNLSSICAYCGQAAVIKDRVEDYLQPDYIVPFKITSEIAEGLIREKFQLAKYVPEEARDFKVEDLHSIYVPYWLYDVYLNDKVIVPSHAHSKKNASLNGVKPGYMFHKIPADGSSKMPDEAAIWLTPYDLSQAVPFDGAYLSGHCAERYDEGSQDKMGTVLNRARAMFLDTFSVRSKNNKKELLDSHVQGKIESCDYYLLPVWVLTFRVHGELKTIYLNGQNGKVVGTVLSWPKIRWTFMIKWLLLSVVLIPVAFLCTKAIGKLLEIDFDYFRQMLSYPIAFVVTAFASLLGTLQYKLDKLYKRVKRAEEITCLRVYK